MAFRILVCDDEKLIRWSLSEHLKKEGYDVSLAEDGEQALAAIEQAPPDALVLDLKMPKIDGMSVLRKLHEQGNAFPVIVITAHGALDSAIEATKLGAAAYLSKSAPPETLIEAVKTVAAGRRYISAEVAQALAERVSSEISDHPHESLSDRELQVLKLIASGKRLADIARDLSISPKTVSVYRARILEKMALESNAELTHYALKNNLVT